MKFSGKGIFLSCIFSVSLSTCASAAATDKRNLTDFCELYMKRYVTAQNDRNIDDNIFIGGYGVMMETDAFFSVSSTAGTLYVYKDSLEISEATFTLCDMIADDEINDRYSMSFISALSALEYDAIDESTMKWESKISGTPRNAFEKAVEIYNSDIYDAVNDYGFADAKNNSDGVLVYSGNYDYFLQYRPFDNGGREYEQYWIGAREHE